MPGIILFALFAVLLATALAAVIYHASSGLRGRRRDAWELERAEWRRWISTP